MRSGGGRAQFFRAVEGAGAPHNPEGGAAAPRWDARRRGLGQRDQMSLCSPFSLWTRDA